MEEENIVAEEATEVINEPKDDGFDPGKFSEPSTPENEGEKETPTDKNQEEVTTEGDVAIAEGEKKDESDFSWADYADEENVTDEKSTSKEENNPKEEVVSEETKKAEEVVDDQTSGSTSFTTDQFKHFADELGLNASSVEEFKQDLIDLEKENEELKKNQFGGVENELIQKLDSYKGMSDEDLIRSELKSQRLTEEEIQEEIDELMDEGEKKFKREANKLRRTLDNKIYNEKQKQTELDKAEEAKLEKQRQDSINTLQEHINGTETMFGLKMAKDEEGLKKVREGHLNYITSGKFLGDVTSSEEKMSKAAWLWKNQEVIMKALVSSGVQKGKESVLNDIGNPEVSDTKRFKGPESGDGFNPKAFAYAK